MSNVLMGMVGVVLFIGLALAGALFLGQKFRMATSNSKASAAIQAVQQVAHAVDLQTLNGNARRAANAPLDDLVSQGYLKSIPTGRTAAPVFLSDESFSNSGPAAFSALSLGLGDDAQRTCAAVEALLRFKADGSVPEESDPNVGSPQAGCIHDSIFGKGYVVFARI